VSSQVPDTETSAALQTCVARNVLHAYVLY